jgi:hypothetical protein
MADPEATTPQREHGDSQPDAEQQPPPKIRAHRNTPFNGITDPTPVTATLGGVPNPAHDQTVGKRGQYGGASDSLFGLCSHRDWKAMTHNTHGFGPSGSFDMVSRSRSRNLLHEGGRPERRPACRNRTTSRSVEPNRAERSFDGAQDDGPVRMVYEIPKELPNVSPAFTPGR